MSEITYIKQKEVKLARAVQYQQEIFDSITEGLAEFGPDGALYNINNAFADLLGYERDELLDIIGWSRITPPELLAQDRHYIERALTGEAVRYEKELIHQDGYRIPISLSYRKLERQADWDQDRLIATVSDITELKQQEQYWQSLFDSASEGLKVLDEQGHLRMVNAIYAERLGYTPEEVSAPGFNWLEAFFDQSGRERMRAKLKEAIQTDEIVRFENPHRHKDGYSVMIMTSLRLMPESASAPARQLKLVLSTMSDITPIKEKEAELAQLVKTHQRSVIEAIGMRLAQLASGDLATAVPDDLEGEMKQLGVDLATALSTMRETLDQVKQAAFETRHNMLELEQGNINLSQRTLRQAAAVEEISAAMEELSASVNQSAGQAEVSTTRAVEVKGYAEKGSGLIYAVEEKMRAIAEAAKTMSDIIEVVNGIAFTTNILALNAAVEAARAGEHGRGFAVVAQEVRRLSQSSAENAKDIKRLIDGIVQLVGEGNALSRKGSGSFAEILEGMNEVSQRVADMAFAMESQRSATDQVASAVMEVNVLTQENSALVQENSTAFATLGDQADQLNGRVRAFKLDIDK